ncbi:MAG: hypothetical protein A3G81_05445 [Betaproteobacteria bacterium RIFCSPLOWO2_12_FULL_65_14]|nr:MAG: hypothetical protein A3G81_05445 [Betaproteobacteria bacterium RIFCSPLOWO2_12_FULL_65_14]
MEDERILNGAGDGLAAVDIAQGDDFAQVMTCIGATLFKAVVVALGLGGQTQEAQPQALLAGVGARGDERHSCDQCTPRRCLKFLHQNHVNRVADLLPFHRTTWGPKAVFSTFATRNRLVLDWARRLG